jgi:phosphoserine phosphatase RsbU/P
LAILELVTELGTGLFYALDRDETVIGRQPECDIVLTGERISRRHARVVRRPKGFVVEDLGSRNGTFVNGVPIADPRPLEQGDEIVVDQSRLLFHVDTPSPRDEDDGASGVTATIVFDPRKPARRAANPGAQLRAIMELTTQLARAVSPEEIQVALLSTLFRVFPSIRRGFVLLPDDAGELRIATRRRNTGASADTTTAGPVWVACKRAFVEQETILFREEADAVELPPDDLDAEDTALGAGGARSLICAPLRGTEGQVHGVVQIDRRGSDAPFSLADLELVSAIAGIAGQATENNQRHAEHLRARLQEQELRLAAGVQRLLVPSDPPIVEGFEVFHYYEPAKQVGGDYFDYVPLSGGRLAVAIGDVAGKDVSAALLMTRLSAAVQLCLDVEDDLAAAVGRINRVIGSRTASMRFVTFLVAVLDPESENVTMVVAGHVPPMVRRRDGRVEVIESTGHGPPLGILPDVEYEVCSFPLAKGESFLLCTDGLTEAHAEESSELYGVSGISRTLSDLDDSASIVGRALLNAAREFTGGAGMSDDVCVLTVRRTR